MSDPISRINAALEGRYAIERELGEGGMATVYLADDLKHQRKVALKVLKPELAALVGAERFLAEITTTANLTHPHILPLHDSGEADGFLFYVMPYIEGESLREWLDREKQLGVEDSVAITRKVADALDYAHENGIVHRDIKPANILISQRGEPLVADFGIALAVAQAGAGRITETGLSLGTPHYMSPEQATGDRDVDPRSDVFALGCVLYEMLSGQPPFSASSAQAVLVKILTVDAPSITSERRTVPPHVGGALAKALEKLPADRFASAAEFATALGDESFTYEAGARTSAAAPVPASLATQAPATMPGPWKHATVTLAAVAVVLAVTLVRVLVGPDPLIPVTRVSVDFPEDEEVVALGTFDISPDGSLLVYEGPGAAGNQLWARRWAALNATPIRDTENVNAMAISPDGQDVAFDTEGSIRVVPIQGGIARTVAPDSVRCCVRWSPDGAWLYFNTPAQGLSRVPAAGGPVEVVTQLDTAAGGGQHLWIDVLPGGEAAVYQVTDDGNGANPRLFAVRVESGEVKELRSGQFPRYSQGHLLFTDLEGTTLFAQPFDVERLELSGTATPIAEGLRGPIDGWSYYAVSQTGSLFYSTGSGSGAGARLVLLDLEGNEQPLALTPRNIGAVNWSPDGRTVAYIGAPEGDQSPDIYTYDVETGTERQLTFEGNNVYPVFSPDSNRVVFMSLREGTDAYDLFVKRLDNDEPATLMITLPGTQVPTQWPSDELIVFSQGPSLEAPADLWMLDLSDPDSPRAEAYLEREDDRLASIKVSPDGTLAAYTSDETGRNEIYIRSFPVPGERTPVSQNGGEFPSWSPDGNTLYYWTRSGAGRGGYLFMAAHVQRNPTPVVLSRESLFAGNDIGSADLHPDGDRIIVGQMTGVSAGPGADPLKLIMVTNWLEELLERAGPR